MSQPSPRQRLDVESPEERQARLGALLSSISNATPHLDAPPGPSTSPPSRPFAMPESSVLARARDFLPMMAQSNQELEERMRDDPKAVDIEDTEGDERVIAMDVNLGVFDVSGQPTGDLGPEVTLPDRAGALSEPEDEEDETDTSDETSDDDSEDDGEAEDVEDGDQRRGTRRRES